MHFCLRTVLNRSKLMHIHLFLESNLFKIQNQSILCLIFNSVFNIKLRNRIPTSKHNFCTAMALWCDADLKNINVRVLKHCSDCSRSKIPCKVTSTPLILTH
jgi:hypothetical protein